MTFNTVASERHDDLSAALGFRPQPPTTAAIIPAAKLPVAELGRTPGRILL